MLFRSIDFAHNLPFGDTADSGVTAHLGDFIHIHRHQKCTRTEPGRSMSGLATGMAGAYYYNIEIESQNKKSLVRTARRAPCLRLLP